MFFNHLPELLGLLVLGLLIFGPKRMIEAGSQLGRMLRETQSALKEMDWGLGDDKAPNPFSSSRTPLGKLSQFAQAMTASRADDAPASSAARSTTSATVETTAHVVEATATAPTPSDSPAE
jgi:sec-independent protein translocase protein TatA